MDKKRKNQQLESADDKILKNMRVDDMDSKTTEVEYPYDFYTLSSPQAPDTTAKVLDKISKRGKDQLWNYESDFQRVCISELNESPDDDTISTCVSLCDAMNIREKWISMLSGDLCDPPQLHRRVSVMAEAENGVDDVDMLPPVRYAVLERTPSLSTTRYICKMVNGVTSISISGDPSRTTISRVLSFEEFLEDFNKLRRTIYAGPVVSYSYTQLECLTYLFDLHLLLNKGRENEASRLVPYRDFYNTRKVDTHVHHSACMNETHLLKFMKQKLKQFPDEIVVCKDGQEMTLCEVFTSLNLTAADLSIDTLDMHAHNTFYRFDRFNLKYNPAGQSLLREIFLKTDNYIKGRYLAELTKEVIDELEANKYSIVEWRVSIYGIAADEWSKLAEWFYSNRLAHENVRWMIQVPRLFDSYRSRGKLKNFEEMLKNIFDPLFAVTLDPSSNIALNYFLDTIVGFDSVDDESRPEWGNLSSGSASLPKPAEWVDPVNPPYGYYLYYMYANISALNQLRASRGMTTFQFRPHCGEAGDADHLISAYILANQVNHGIRLRKLPSLQFLFYLSQVGIAMSPLSNNKLFLAFNKNPFPVYFKQGLNVSLSTDDPLLLHCTKDPLVEEYSVATQVWNFTPTDQCEIARNSVLQSGLEDEYKRHFLGEDFKDVCRTNVPMIRLRYREETLQMMTEKLRRVSELASSTKQNEAVQST